MCQNIQYLFSSKAFCTKRNDCFENEVIFYSAVISAIKHALERPLGFTKGLGECMQLQDVRKPLNFTKIMKTKSSRGYYDCNAHSNAKVPPVFAIFSYQSVIDLRNDSYVF